jgi:hypothetical protein
MSPSDSTACKNVATFSVKKEVRMAELKEDGLVKSVEGLLADKQALAAREKKMIDDLNTVLGKMGYRVVANKSSHAGTGTGRKVGRPPGSGKGLAPKGTTTP